MNLILKEISRTEVIYRTQSFDTGHSIYQVHSKQSKSSLTAQGVYWYVCSTRITTLYYVSFLYRFLTATFTNLIQGEVPWMYSYLIFLSIYVYLLNTSIPPPSIQVFPYLLRGLFQYSGVLYSNSYCGLLMFY